MTKGQGRGAVRHSDEGSAMMLTLMVMVVITALAATMTTLTVNNLQSSRRAQQAGVALNAAEAGVARVLSYVRSNGVRLMNACSHQGATALPECASFPWSYAVEPSFQPVGGTSDVGYRATIRPSTTPATPHRYVVRSTGEAPGEASRTVEVTFDVSEVRGIAKGVVARERVTGNGSLQIPKVKGMSVFSLGCVSGRSKLVIDPNVEDLAYNIPAAVHAPDIVSSVNAACIPENSIHVSGPCHSTGTSPFYFDQSSQGGVLEGTICKSKLLNHPGYDSEMAAAWLRYYADGSDITDANDVLQTFDIRPTLTAQELDGLRNTARRQGNLWTSSSTWSAAADSVRSPDDTHAVLFFDVPAGDRVDLNLIKGFDSTTCGTRSLVIVVNGGDVTLNSNQELVASLFVTGAGDVTRANGTARFVGSMYADSIDLTGTVNLEMEECFLANPSPSFLNVDVVSYVEDDIDL